MKHLQARVSDEDWKFVRQLSLDTGLSVQVLVITALRFYAKNKDNPNLLKENDHGQED